jgi:hypothetical protein
MCDEHGMDDCPVVYRGSFYKGQREWIRLYSHVCELCAGCWIDRKASPTIM